MRKLKRITAAVICVAMMVTAYGCGGNKGKSASGSDAPPEKTSENTSEQSSEDTDDDDWTVTEEDTVSGEMFWVQDGDVIFDINFDDGDLQGFTSYMNGGNFDLYVEDGQLTANISDAGPLDYACQAYWDGFALVEGCEYTYSFDISCDKERDIQWRLQINGGDYHAYAGEIITIGSETKTISTDFVMSETSDPSPRVAFNMGVFDGMDEDFGGHIIKIDNLKLTVKDCSGAASVERIPAAKKVKVNQIGYRPEDVKKVVTASADDERFKVINVDTGEAVFVGEYEKPYLDISMGQQVRIGDFSEVKTSGRYKILSSPSGESYEFRIGDGLYDDIYRDAVLMLYRQRCGTELDKGIAGGFAHEVCHSGSALIYGSAEKSEKDVSGGWHDAGDYGRYVVTGAKTIQDLFLAYEDYGADFDDIGIPESGNDVPDLLDEARYELEWLLKMQNEENGGVYHKVTCLNFPGTVMPEEETEQLYLAPVSYAATADFAAVMAKASTLYEKYDAEFAASCLEASKSAYDYAKTIYKGNEGYVNPLEVVTGEYADKKLKDERLWAAAELYLATKEKKYLTVVKKMLESDFSLGLGWAAIGSYALYDLAKADGIDDGIKNTAADLLSKEADELVEFCKESAFGIDQGPSFVWGSNMRVANTGMTLLMANRVSPNEEYVNFATRQRDYIFGVNGPSYCFVTGYGAKSPENPHHRPSQSKGRAMKGMLVGGADSALEDPYAMSVLSGVAPAYAYVDNDQSYSCNEVTIYWNSPLIYLMTGLK